LFWPASASASSAASFRQFRQGCLALFFDPHLVGKSASVSRRSGFENQPVLKDAEPNSDPKPPECSNWAKG
jgi:hypothetical protein